VHRPTTTTNIPTASLHEPDVLITTSNADFSGQFHTVLTSSSSSAHSPSPSLELGHFGKFPESSPNETTLGGESTKIWNYENRCDLSNSYTMVYSFLVQGKLSQADKMFKEGAAYRAKLLGSNHPDKLKYDIEIARILNTQSRFEEAEEYVRELLARANISLGPEDQHTLNLEGLLNETVETQKKYPRGLWRRRVSENGSYIRPELFSVEEGNMIRPNRMCPEVAWTGRVG
jgi:hypothetical protein